MQQSNSESFLKTCTTLAVLSMDGKEPEEKERLNKSASCIEISYFRRIKILFGIVKGLQALLILREYNDFGYFLAVFRLEKYKITALML